MQKRKEKKNQQFKKARSLCTFYFLFFFFLPVIYISLYLQKIRTTYHTFISSDSLSLSSIMYLSTEKVFSLFVLASPGKFFPVQQSPLPLDLNSDIGSFQDNGLIRDVEYGYKGPGVYHISGSSDLFNLVPDQIGSGDGAPVVVWYVHTYPNLPV